MAGTVKSQVFNTEKGLLVPQSGAYCGIFSPVSGAGREVFSATLAASTESRRKAGGPFESGLQSR